MGEVGPRAENVAEAPEDSLIHHLFGSRNFKLIAQRLAT